MQCQGALSLAWRVIAGVAMEAVKEGQLEMAALSADRPRPSAASGRRSPDSDALLQLQEGKRL